MQAPFDSVRLLAHDAEFYRDDVIPLPRKQPTSRFADWPLFKAYSHDAWVVVRGKARNGTNQTTGRN